MFRKNQYVWLYAGIMLCFNLTTALGVTTYYFKWIIGNTGLMAVTSVFSIVTLPLMLTFPAIMKKIGTRAHDDPCAVRDRSGDQSGAHRHLFEEIRQAGEADSGMGGEA